MIVTDLLPGGGPWLWLVRDRTPSLECKRCGHLGQGLAEESALNRAFHPEFENYAKSLSHLDQRNPPLMEAKDLIGLGPEELSSYVWNRLRLETPIDPPLVGLYGEEPPEDRGIYARGRESDAGSTPLFTHRQ